MEREKEGGNREFHREKGGGKGKIVIPAFLQSFLEPREKEESCRTYIFTFRYLVALVEVKEGKKQEGETRLS